MAQSLLGACREEADQGFPEAGGFTPQAFYHMVGKAVLIVGEKFPVLSLVSLSTGCLNVNMTWQLISFSADNPRETW